LMFASEGGGGRPQHRAESQHDSHIDLIRMLRAAFKSRSASYLGKIYL
jgi:hypothetical protein